MDIFEAEESLKTHPYVKAHTVERFKFKELDPDGWKVGQCARQKGLRRGLQRACTDVPTAA